MVYSHSLGWDEWGWSLFNADWKHRRVIGVCSSSPIFYTVSYIWWWAPLSASLQSSARNVQGQAGWGSQQCGPVPGVPAHSRGVGTRGSLMSLPTQALLWVSHKGKNTTRRTQEQVDVSWQPLKYNFKPYKSGLNLYSESMSLKLTLNAGFFLYARSSQLKSHFIILSFLYLHLIKDEKWCHV